MTSHDLMNINPETSARSDAPNPIKYDVINETATGKLTSYI